MQLSDEQSRFVSVAQEGKNILVDACIGSGKQQLFRLFARYFPKGKNIISDIQQTS